MKNAAIVLIIAACFLAACSHHPPAKQPTKYDFSDWTHPQIKCLNEALHSGSMDQPSDECK